MRKLLTLLAISGIVGSASTNTISCKNALKDIGKLNFTKIVSSTKLSGIMLYDNVRKQIAEYAGSKVLPSDIWISPMLIDIGLKVGDQITEIVESSDPVISGQYEVKITVFDGDKWFYSTVVVLDLEVEVPAVDTIL